MPLKAFSETISTNSETINVNPVEPILASSGLADFETRVYQVIEQMKELGYEPTIMQVRDFVRGIEKSGDLTEFILQLEKKEEITNPIFSEGISTGDEFKEIELTAGSPGWEKLKKDIEKWKKTGGVLEAKLSGKKIDVQEKEQQERRKEFKKLSPAGITVSQWRKMTDEIAGDFKMTKEQVSGLITSIAECAFGGCLPDYYKGKINEKVLHAMGLTLEDLRKIQSVPGKIPPWYRDINIPETSLPANIIFVVGKTGVSVKDFLQGWDKVQTQEVPDLSRNEWKALAAIDVLPEEPGKIVAKLPEEHSEIALAMGSKQWQRLRDDIKRWKKEGGVLKAKLKGKKGEEIKKRIEELATQRGAKLTSEEMNEIAATPGVIPPWWKGSDGYYTGARRAIKKLGVSAMDVHIAVERDYTNQPLNEMQKTILKVGWPNA